jgi:SpoVK/Ycf46/Vps4 family AAA+-type ATPase
MRALFRDYRTACAENDRMPILLFNEADAILGKRMEGAVRSVDRMENSVQNILLQEMESFEGILIATTNLFGNLDPAFERRFLFKVRFNKPEPEPRKQIWKAQFPILSDEEAASLAGEFSFSGGQIENVVRKYTIDSILSDREGGYPQIFQLCREESATQSSTRTKIGF